MFMLPISRFLYVFCCVFAIFAACLGCNTGGGHTPKISSPMKDSFDLLIDKYQISFRVGHEELTPSGGMLDKVMVAVDHYNKQSALFGLEDHSLNPFLLDDQKTRAFLNGFSRLDPEFLEKLKGKTVYLNGLELKLAPGYPLSATDLESGFELALKDESAERPEIGILVKENAELALQTAPKAKAVVNHEDALVLDLENQETEIRKGRAGNLPQVLQQLSLARSRRHAVCMVWHANVEALARQFPEEKAYQLELQEARAALDRFLVAPSSGMPGGGMP